MMMMMMMMMMMCTVTDDSGVFTRERAAGLYRLSAYYLAVMTTEIPVTFILTTVFVVVVYWMVNLMPATLNFIAHWLILELSTFTAQVQHRILLLVATRISAAAAAAAAHTCSMSQCGFRLDALIRYGE